MTFPLNGLNWLFLSVSREFNATGVEDFSVGRTRCTFYLSRFCCISIRMPCIFKGDWSGCQQKKKLRNCDCFRTISWCDQGWRWQKGCCPIWPSWRGLWFFLSEGISILEINVLFSFFYSSDLTCKSYIYSKKAISAGYWPVNRMLLQQQQLQQNKFPGLWNRSEHDVISPSSISSLQIHGATIQ